MVPGTLVHLVEPLGLFSRTYFSILDPPLSLGGFHSKVISLGVVLTASNGPSGAAGLSEEFDSRSEMLK